MGKRYYVDLRNGCVAVRDRTLDLPRDECPGLHPDTPGVVRFWRGELVWHECPTCGHRTSSHGVPSETVEAADKLCEELNATNVNTE